MGVQGVGEHPVRIRDRGAVPPLEVADHRHVERAGDADERGGAVRALERQPLGW